MLIRALFTTALVFTNLPRNIEAKSVSSGASITPHPPLSELKICPHALPASTLIKESVILPPVTLLLTKDRILPTITGFNETQTHFIADCILSIIEIHPNIAEYIHLVFNYMPYFTISRFIDGKTMKPVLLEPITGNVAQYESDKAAMQVYDSFFERSKEMILSILIHEFRHAAINAAYRVLENASPFNSDIYPLHDMREKKIVLNLIKQGEKKLLELEKMLSKEFNEKNVLTQDEKKYLARLRKEALPDYNKFYRNLEISIIFDTDEYVRLLASIRLAAKDNKVKFEERRIYQIDALYDDSHYGPFEITKIGTKADKDKSTIQFMIKMNDPLYAFLTHYKAIKGKIQRYHGAIEDYSCEMDAYLNQFIPQNLLIKFFPGLHSYPKKLIEQAMGTDSNNQITNAMDGEPQYNKDIIKTIRTPEFFTLDLENHYLLFAERALKSNEYDDAELALKTLINNKSRYSNIAFTLLGVFAYNKKNFAVAIEHFDKAEKISPLDDYAKRAYAQAIAYEIANKRRQNIKLGV